MRISHTVGYRQVGSNVVLVLRIQIKGVLPYLGCKIQFGLREIAYLADQKASPFLLESAITRRICTEKCKPAVARIAAGIVFVLLIAMVAEAELEGVMLSYPGE